MAATTENENGDISALIHCINANKLSVVTPNAHSSHEASLENFRIILVEFA